MDAIQLLKQQHRLVESLFEELEATGDAEEKLELLQELADNFAAHATIEERIFYPTAYGKGSNDETKELLEEAVEEHLSAKRILADLLEMSASDENFDAKIKVLKEQIEHHVEEEEGQLFPQVSNQIEAGLLESMGQQMEELFDETMSEGPSADIPGETERAAPLKGKRGRPRV